MSGERFCKPLVGSSNLSPGTGKINNFNDKTIAAAAGGRPIRHRNTSAVDRKMDRATAPPVAERSRFVPVSAPRFDEVAG